MTHLFEFEPYAETPTLRYAGSGIAHQVLVGPGRPEEGHTHIIPQIRVDPEPAPAGSCLIEVRGPLFGRSRTELTIYGGASRDGWGRMFGAGGPGEGAARSIMKVGGGWLIRVRTPRVVRWSRPNGRRTEAHCAEEKWWPSGSIAVWADATQGIALVGFLEDVGGHDLGEPLPEVWLPTRSERRRVAGGSDPELVVTVAYRTAGLFHDLPVPPWAEPFDADRDEARALGERLLRGPEYCGAAAWAAFERLTQKESSPRPADDPIWATPRARGAPEFDAVDFARRLRLLVEGNASWSDQDKWNEWNTTTS